MKKLAALLLAISVLATPGEAAPRLKGEAALARAIEGRVAGEPVDCINLRNIRSTRVIDRTAIVYDAGSTIYVNRPRAGQQSLNGWDALLTRTFSNRLCSIDVVHTLDATSRFQRGTVFLGEFVPYRKVRR